MVDVDAADDIDPNFEAHLPSLLKVGLQERTSPELATKLRERFKQITVVKKEAAKALKEINEELAVEMDELADELDETTEKFVLAATQWDAWSRPSPDLPRELRAKSDLENVTTDPNFEAHLSDFLSKGLMERPNSDLPSALRLMKFKNTANVKRLAAKELKTSNPILSETLEEMALEIEESHERFVEMARTRAAMDRDDSSEVDNWA